MERDEFKQLVKGMKAVYAQPTFIPDQDAFNVWYELLKDLQYKHANIAIQKYMLTEVFPPTIASIRKIASEVVQKPPDEISELEAWNIVRKAIGNSGYHAEEEFAKLPKVCQLAVGSPANLREWAMMDSDTVGTVEQSHFIRNYRTMAKRIAEDNCIPEGLRNLIEQSRTEYTQLESRAKPALEVKAEPEEVSQAMSEETKERLNAVLRDLKNRR